MQLRLSLVTVALLSSMASQADDYVSVQFLQYDENLNRTSVSAPSIEINKDLGTDYTLNASFVADAVSGASQNYYDSTSGASAYSRGSNSDVKYDNVEYSDNRLAGGLSLTTRFANRDELTVGGNYSTESDFYSAEVSAEYMHWLNSSKNSSVSFGLSYQSNEILIRDCKENSDCDTSSGASEKMTADVLNVQASYFQNIDQESSAKVSLFYITDSGYLGNPYLNVVRNYDTVTAKADIVAEKRPDTKSAYGVSLKYANALSSELAWHVNYRYYSDDWEISSHTLNNTLYYELGKDWLFTLGLRAYMQSEASFYNQSKDYFTNEVYASSDFRLSDFTALTYKTAVEYKVNDKTSINFGANYYDQSTGLKATYFITGFTYHF